MLSVRDKLKLDFAYLTIKRLDRLKREEHEKTGKELDVLIREYLLKGSKKSP